MKKIVAAGSIILLTLIAACAGSIPVPTERHDRLAAREWPGTTHSDLVQGRQLYIDNCSGCHGLKSPTDYSAAEWRENVAEMKMKAKIRSADSELILKYLLVANRERERTDTTAAGQ